MKDEEIDDQAEQAWKEWEEFQSQIRAEHIPKLVTFYKKYKPDCQALIEESIYREDEDFTCLRMLDGIQNFVELADNVEQMKRNTEQIRVFLLISLCESLYNLHSGADLKPQERVKRFFSEFLGEDINFFKYKFRRSLVDSQCLREKGVHLTVDELVGVLYFLRNQFTHEGIGYNFHFSHDGETSTMNHLKRGREGYEIYDVVMTFEQFRDVIVRMGIRCAEDYMSKMMIREAPILWEDSL